MRVKKYKIYLFFSKVDAVDRADSVDEMSKP